MISFKVPTNDLVIIEEIVDRALAMYRQHKNKYDKPYDRMDCHMDITVCHANGCPLRLRELLEADDSNFAHDVFGIRRHLNRETGQLEDCFLPRFAA